MPVNRPVPISAYYSGQGRLIIGERDPLTGAPINLYQVGNCTALEITIATTETDHKESMSGERAIDFTVVSEKNATFSITCESLSLKNLSLGFWGEVGAEVAGSAADIPVAMDAGAYITLPHQNIDLASFTLVDESDQPVDAELYDFDHEFGVIRFDATATQVDAVAAYDYNGVSRLDALTQVAAPERFVRFEGINTINGELVLVEIPRAQFSPLQNLPLINEEVASFTMEGKILQDQLAVEAGDIRYYRQTMIKPA